MMQDYLERRTWRTTKQMQAAPTNAVFVWVHHDLYYPRKLAKAIGREDLTLVGPNWLLRGLIGRRDVVVIVDHACRLTKNQVDQLAIYNANNRGCVRA